MNNPPIKPQTTPKNPSYRPPKLASAEWTEFDPRSSPKHITCVYRIQVMDPKDPSRSFPIPGFAAIDHDGVLEIGQTVDLASKGSSFRRAVLGNPNGDREGYTFYYYYTHNKWLRDTFGSKEEFLDLIKFTYIPTEKERLLSAESDAIDHHISLYGEPPVTNGEVPGLHRWFEKGPADIIKRPSPQLAKERYPTPLDGKWLTAPPRSPYTDLPCIYRIHLLQHDDPARYFPIPRFGETDPEGILKIGKTKHLGRRREEFRNAIMGKGRNGDGELFRHEFELCERLQEAVGPKEDILDRILFTYIKTKPSLLDVRENRVTDRYIGQFAELPPVDSQIPGKYGSVKK